MLAYILAKKSLVTISVAYIVRNQLCTALLSLLASSSANQKKTCLYFQCLFFLFQSGQSDSLCLEDLVSTIDSQRVIVLTSDLPGMYP